MNEHMQLRAIAAELRAEGWQVFFDASAEKFGLPDSLPVLDLVAKQSDREPGDRSPGILIIEAANRRRVWISDRGDATFGAHDADADEAQALYRISAISDAIAELPPGNVGFQIRFLDISVDQAQARHLTQVRTTDSALRSEIDLTRKAMASLGKTGREAALVTAFHWCRWLRLMGNRFPGRGHAELKLADLRTIQKDLWDAGLLETAPVDYFEVHQSIMGLAEGGDVRWRDLKDLRVELERLISHMAGRLGVETLTRDDGPRGRHGAELFENIALVLRLSGRDDEPGLVSALARLRTTDGLPEYRQALLDFEDVIDGDERLTVFSPQLRDLARQIRN